MNCQTEYCKNVDLRFSGGRIAFDFPMKDGKVGTIACPHDPIVRPVTADNKWYERLTATVRYKITKIWNITPVFDFLDKSGVTAEHPGYPPSFRIMLSNQPPGVASSGTRYYTAGDHYSTLVFSEGVGFKVGTLGVPLSAKFWQTVNGKLATEDIVAWKRLLKNLQSICLVFGGGNTFAHGVWLLKGAVRFEYAVSIL